MRELKHQKSRKLLLNQRKSVVTEDTRQKNKDTLNRLSPSESTSLGDSLLIYLTKIMPMMAAINIIFGTLNLNLYIRKAIVIPMNALCQYSVDCTT